MVYQLKGGEEIRDGKLHGWTGRECPRCKGTAETPEGFACRRCGGTGEEWGLMPEQPKDLTSEPMKLDGDVGLGTDDAGD